MKYLFEKRLSWIEFIIIIVIYNLIMDIIKEFIYKTN